MTPQREWFEKDFYKVLDVAQDASEKDITRAYRKLAKRFHPDANQGNPVAEERFKEIAAAYDVLSDAARRKEYDEVRRMVAAGVGGPGAGQGGFGPRGPGGAQFDFGDGSGGMGDLFGGLFNRTSSGRRGRGAAGPRPGSDLETELHVDFLDAIHGVTTTVRFTADAACQTCSGTGARAGTTPQRCPRCAGTGSVAVDQGPFSFSEVCPTCGGRGGIVTDPCSTCSGSGVERRQREVKVRIPAGVEDGQRIRVKGRGAAGSFGGPPGNLYVIVHVGAHALFGRSGKDLTVRVPITFPEAVLGAQVRVPTMGEPVVVKVPPGTTSGKKVRVRGHGIPNASGVGGDLIVTFDVQIPTELDQAERDAIEALATVSKGDPRAHLGV